MGHAVHGGAPVGRKTGENPFGGRESGRRRLESRPSRYSLRSEVCLVRVFWHWRPFGSDRSRHSGAVPLGRVVAEPCLLDKLYRQDTRLLAREPRAAGLTTDTTGSVSPHVAERKVTVTVALGPAPKNSSARFEERSIRGMSHAKHPCAYCGKQFARQRTGPD